MNNPRKNEGKNIQKADKSISRPPISAPAVVQTQTNVHALAKGMRTAAASDTKPSEANDPYSTPARRRRIIADVARFLLRQYCIKACNNVAIYRRERAASIRIQCLIRRFFAGRVLLCLHSDQRKKSAILLQSVVRRKLAYNCLRRKYRKLRLKFLGIVVCNTQRLWRGYVAKCRVLQLRESNRLRQEKVRLYGTVMIQKYFRGHLGRKLYYKLKQDMYSKYLKMYSASVKIQCLYRRWQAARVYRMKLIRRQAALCVARNVYRWWERTEIYRVSKQKIKSWVLDQVIRRLQKRRELETALAATLVTTLSEDSQPLARVLTPPEAEEDPEEEETADGFSLTRDEDFHTRDQTEVRVPVPPSLLSKLVQLGTAYVVKWALANGILFYEREAGYRVGYVVEQVLMAATHSATTKTESLQGEEDSRKQLLLSRRAVSIGSDNSPDLKDLPAAWGEGKTANLCAMMKEGDIYLAIVTASAPRSMPSPTAADSFAELLQGPVLVILVSDDHPSEATDESPVSADMKPNASRSSRSEVKTGRLNSSTTKSPTKTPKDIHTGVAFSSENYSPHSPLPKDESIESFQFHNSMICVNVIREGTGPEGSTMAIKGKGQLSRMISRIVIAEEVQVAYSPKKGALDLETEKIEMEAQTAKAYRRLAVLMQAIFRGKQTRTKLKRFRQSRAVSRLQRWAYRGALVRRWQRSVHTLLALATRLAVHVQRIFRGRAGRRKLLSCRDAAVAAMIASFPRVLQMRLDQELTSLPPRLTFVSPSSWQTCVETSVRGSPQSTNLPTNWQESLLAITSPSSFPLTHIHPPCTITAIARPIQSVTSESDTSDLNLLGRDSFGDVNIVSGTNNSMNSRGLAESFQRPPLPPIFRTVNARFSKTDKSTL